MKARENIHTIQKDQLEGILTLDNLDKKFPKQISILWSDIQINKNIRTYIKPKTQKKKETNHKMNRKSISLRFHLVFYNRVRCTILNSMINRLIVNLIIIIVIIHWAGNKGRVFRKQNRCFIKNIKRIDQREVALDHI